MSFVVNAVWRARAGSEQIVADAVAHLVEESRREPGNLLYQPYHSPEEPGVFRFFEIYRDEEAFQAHGASEHFQRWGFGVAIPELEERTREFYTTLDVETGPSAG
jgi:quinol monooxygenase YgiN